MMERLLHFWTRYCPQLSDQSRLFITDRHTLSRYAKEQIIKLSSEPFPYFAVVMDGLVGGYESTLDRGPALHEAILPFDFFTGTPHAFTHRTRHIEYLAIRPTEVLLLPLAEARAGQRQFPEIAELFHVMKQRKINQLRKLISVYHERDLYNRYRVYADALPQWTQCIPHGVQAQLLRMSRPSYQRVKKRYLQMPLG